MERVFLFAAMWSFGGALSSDSKSDDRRTFSQEWRRLLPPKTVKIPEQVSALFYTQALLCACVLMFGWTTTKQIGGQITIGDEIKKQFTARFMLGEGAGGESASSGEW